MNILGFNIGQNYKGILNLGSTINSPLSGTLQAVTDGMGNASPLQLSTTDLSVTQGVVSRLLISTDITMRRSDNTLFFQYSNAPDVLELNGNTIRLNTLRGSTAIGHSVAAARLHVRGDGTNNVARFENSAGTSGLFINPAGDYLGLIGNVNTGFAFGSNFIDLYTNNAAGASQAYFSVFGRNSSAVAGTTYGLDLGGVSRGSTTGFGLAATTGSANFRPLSLVYTINNSGAQTGTATGIFLNATETALNGMTHNLMDLQRGGISQFTVSRSGEIIPNVIYCNLYWGKGPSPLSFSNFNGLIQILGTTNAFPALKRNGAGLQIRLADDSGFAGLEVSNISASGISSFGGGVAYVSTSGWANIQGRLGIGFFGDANASAILQADSTTRGFLPPRMTEAQRLAIAGGTPAIGLMVYQTDASDGLYVYKAGGWTLII